MFEFTPTSLQGCYEIQPKVMADHRGTFSKLFHSATFRARGLAGTFDDVEYSVLPRNVIRGLHFQIPPDQSTLLVTCVSGSLLGVVTDLRKNSGTTPGILPVRLEAAKGNMLYIPGGMAYGVLSLEDNAVMLSMCSKEQRGAPKDGIHWASIGFDWPVEQPIVSDADQRLAPLADYPFRF